MEVGQFWPIPLSDGGFACGIVLDIVAGSRRAFLAGLLEWRGYEEPSPKNVADSQVIEQGEGHIKMIKEGYGQIVGVLPPEIKPPLPLLWVEHLRGKEWGLYRGLDLIEVIDAKQARAHPIKRTWGYNLINLLAERRLGTQQNKD